MVGDDPPTPTMRIVVGGKEKGMEKITKKENKGMKKKGKGWCMGLPIPTVRMRMGVGIATHTLARSQ